MYEVLWKVLFTGISVMMVCLSGKIYQFHTRPEFAGLKKGYISDLLMYAVPVALLHSLFDWAWHQKVDDYVFKHYLSQDRYADEVARRRRSYTIAKWGYSLIYYLLSSVLGYCIVRETSFLPSFLGGHGSVYSLIELRYLEEATPAMAVYYYVQLGKHLSRFFGHVFVRPEGNFYEYVLHHSLSAFLIVFSYCMDMWTIGTFVLVLHDWTDFCLILVRAYKDYRHRSSLLLGALYVNATCNWILFRNFVFCYCCVYPAFYQCFIMETYLNEAEIEVFFAPYYFMSAMMACLEVMHLFWTYFIIESFISVNVSDKTIKHSYD